ncbi:unnamed protein product [Microthlaspi erraticum]|uniref:Uncharacterized protein n=1 Tax=Microthlaspi erraticum TaxID=1685480 RepID=A0A6D2L4X3_9BRAS|nr:unnamed protein product [Microthlaspi erraticum]
MYWLASANGRLARSDDKGHAEAAKHPLLRADGEDKGCREGRDVAVWRIFEPDWFGIESVTGFARLRWLASINRWKGLGQSCLKLVPAAGAFVCKARLIKSPSLGETLTTICRGGGVFGWTFGQEVANHALQLYKLDTMAAQVKFMEWWEHKSH